jgi:hypothetical protein
VKDTGWRGEFFIADSSSDVRALRDQLQALSAQSGVTIQYSGPPERAAFIDALVRKDIPRHVAAATLIGGHCAGTNVGVNRNAVLLGSLGRLLFSVDDDTICAPGAVSDLAGADTLKLGSENSSSELWFFPDRASACGFLRPIRACDILHHLAMHLKSLCV